MHLLDLELIFFLLASLELLVVFYSRGSYIQERLIIAKIRYLSLFSIKSQFRTSPSFKWSYWWYLVQWYQQIILKKRNLDVTNHQQRFQQECSNFNFSKKQWKEIMFFFLFLAFQLIQITVILKKKLYIVCSNWWLPFTSFRGIKKTVKNNQS